jgi:hypothetical protein
MASQALICANQNLFNSAILEKDAFYFSNTSDVSNYINTVEKREYASYVEKNLTKVEKIYEWNNIIDQYENHFETIYSTKK